MQQIVLQRTDGLKKKPLFNTSEGIVVKRARVKRARQLGLPVRSSWAVIAVKVNELHRQVGALVTKRGGNPEEMSFRQRVSFLGIAVFDFEDWKPASVNVQLCQELLGVGSYPF